MQVRRTIRTFWPLMLGFVVWGVSACGLGSSPQANGKPQPHPLVTLSRARRLATLKPAAITVQKLSGSQSRATAEANLTGAGHPDYLTLTMSPSGHSQLVVATASGRTLWSKSSVQSVAILKFGRPHLPVILLQGGLNFCGSGGCQYQGYTWNPSQHRFIPVGNPTSPAFRYDPKTKTFRAVEVSLPTVDGLFGFVSVQNRQLYLLERTYDLWQHIILQPLHYASTGTPAGRWVTAGPVQYQPGGSEPSVTFNTPVELWTAFLEARAMNLPLQGKPLIASAGQNNIWNALAPLGRLGESLTVDTANPKPVVQGVHADVSMMVSGILHPTSPNAQMVSYWVGSEVFSVGGTGVIEHASMDPVHLKVSTVYAVLRHIRDNAVFQRAMAKHPHAVVLVSPVGSAWDVELNQNTPILAVNAKTGVITALGS